jgi:hypothetical protein
MNMHGTIAAWRFLIFCGVRCKMISCLASAFTRRAMIVDLNRRPHIRHPAYRVRSDGGRALQARVDTATKGQLVRRWTHWEKVGGKTERVR